LRFASWSANFRIIPGPQFKQKTEVLADGTHRVVPGREGYICRFTTDYTEREKQAVYEAFPKDMTRGSRLDMQGMPIDNDWKISTFDTDSAPEAIRKDLEKALLENHEYGRMYIKVEVPRIPAPWPKYGEIKSPDAIVKTVTALGLDPAQVAAYERENGNRPEVLSALEALSSGPEVEETIEVAA
jgi:hypothetical protein